MAKLIYKALSAPIQPLLLKRLALAISAGIAVCLTVILAFVILLPDMPFWWAHVILILAGMLMALVTFYLILRQFELYRMSILREATERARGEMALNESKDEYRTVIQQFAEGFALIDEAGKISEWNHVMETITGVPGVEAIGTTMAEIMYRLTAPALLSDTTREAYRSAIFDALDNPESSHLGNLEDLTIRMPGGKLKPVQINRFSIKVDHGHQIGVLVRDDTERKRATDALRESEMRYRTLAEAAHDAIFVVNRDGILEYVNSYAAELFGLPAEIIIGARMDALFPPAVAKAQTDELHTVLNTLESLYTERLTTFQRKDIWLGTRLVPLKDQTGRGRAVLGISRDITSRKQAEEHEETQMRRLEALRAIDLAILGSVDLHSVLTEILAHVTTQLNMDAACVLLLNPDIHTLTYAAGLGFRSHLIGQTQVPLGDRISSQSILNRQAVHLHNPAETMDAMRGALLADEDFCEYYAAPLTVKDHMIGVLEVYSRDPFEAGEDWRIFLEALAGQSAIAVENANLIENLQRSHGDLSVAYEATIEGWSRALDLRDKETEGHTQRVTKMTERLATLMGCGEAELVHIRRGALLHDIGKLGVPDNILLKPGPLTAEEWVLMRQHPYFAYEMIAPIDFLHMALDIPYCHHEKWDGTGYPRGLAGEQIPLGARVFAIVDVWDALRSDRPYRKGWPRDKALEYVREQSGKQFDPQVTEAFLKMTEAEEGQC